MRRSPRSFLRATGVVAAAAILAGPLTGAAVAATTPAPPISDTDTDIRIDRPANVPRAEFELHLVLDGDREGAITERDVDGSTLFLDPQAIVTVSDVTAVRVELAADLEHYAVELHFGDAGAERLAAATKDLGVGRRIAILVGGRLDSAPYVMAPLSSTAMISGRYTRDEAIAFARRLAP